MPVAVGFAARGDGHPASLWGTGTQVKQGGMWDLYRRAEQYGHAMAVVNDYLGEAMREKVMARFQELAGPVQRGGWKEPWEMIAYALRAAGADGVTVRALHIAYLMRTGRLHEKQDWTSEPPGVVERLREWGLL